MRFRPLWNDFKSRFGALLGDLEQQRSLLESHVNQIHIEHSEHDRIKFLDEIDEQRRMRASEKLLAVHQWLQAPSCIRYHEEHQDVRNAHSNGTKYQPGLWLLDNDYVKTWISNPYPRTPFLWIYAKPGAGKSVLSSAIIDQIQEKKNGLVAFFYCKDQDPERRTFRSIVRAPYFNSLTNSATLSPTTMALRIKRANYTCSQRSSPNSCSRSSYKPAPKPFW